jgi:hypothetical protein
MYHIGLGRMNDETTNHAAGNRPNGRFPPHPADKLHHPHHPRSDSRNGRSPHPTPQPTATTSTGSVQATAPTATPEPTPTPTAAEQANQLLLNNGRFTTLLDDLTQEIGRDLSDAEQAQVLALARALWLPDQLDASDWLPDPAGVTLHWRPALDGREGPVVRVVEAQPDSPYAAGAVIFWQAERLLTLTPSQPGSNIEYTTVHKNGQSFSTWVETDTNGQLIRFVDNTSPPDSHTYLKWVNPQDLREDGRFSIFMIQDTDPNNGDSEEFWWTNGGEPIAEYLAANPGHTLSERDGQLVLTDGDTILFTLTNATTGEWEQAVNPAEAFYTQAQALYGERYGINLDPNVEVHPNGRMTIYSIVNGQRVETVRTAINEDGSLYLDENGHPVALFAPEAIALAESIPLQGGNLADRIHISYMPDVPRLPSGQFIILDQARVSPSRSGVKRPLRLTGTKRVIGRPRNKEPSILTSESGKVRIERVNVVLGRIRNQLPGYRAMYTNFTPTGPGSGRNESYGYIWNPDQPEKITIMIYLDDSIFTNRNTDFQYRNSLLLGSMLKGIALLQSRSRPVFNFPKWYRAVDYQCER